MQKHEKELPKTVLYPLEAAGFITLERGTKAGGRGAKPFLVTATEKFTNEILVPLLEQSEKLTNADLRPFLRKPLDEILAELDHKDKHVKGLALEALAIKIMRLIINKSAKPARSRKINSFPATSGSLLLRKIARTIFIE